MTETFKQRLGELYRARFSPERMTLADEKRLLFLDSVITGEIGQKRISIDEAIAEVDENSSTDFVRFLRAARTVRSWFLDPRTKNDAQVDGAIQEGGSDLKPVAVYNEHCKGILRSYRLLELSAELDQTLKSYNSQRTPQEKNTVVQRVDTLIAIAKAFKDQTTLEHMIDIAADYERRGLYPKSKQPETYAARLARDRLISGQLAYAR